VVDRFLIDKVLIGGWVFLAEGFGWIFRMVQAGDIQRYLAVFSLGLAALVWFAAKPANPDEVSVRVDGNTVRVELQGVDPASDALVYRFDFDGDGTAERVGKSPSATWTYSGGDHHDVRITVEDTRWNTQRVLTREIRIR